MRARLRLRPRMHQNVRLRAAQFLLRLRCHAAHEQLRERTYCRWALPELRRSTLGQPHPRA
eukprot:8312968-Alexandrium_andersonii.AAC.1